MRRPGESRSGFTLVEVMTSLFIVLLVVGGLGSFFVGAHRLSRGAYAEAELSVQLRLLREKLLFHVAPPHDGKAWAGLLSGAGVNGAPVVENSFKVRMAAAGVTLSDGTACTQTIELVPHTQTDSDGTVQRWLVNDGDRVDDQWSHPYLRPMSGYLQADWLDDTELAARHLFFITVDATMNGVSRRERIAVPVFGTLQVRSTKGVFHDQ